MTEEEEIERLTKDLHLLIETACNEDYFGLEELYEVNEQMALILEQGVFWLKQENPQRFIYDLRNFTMWLCDYLNSIESNGE